MDPELDIGGGGFIVFIISCEKFLNIILCYRNIAIWGAWPLLLPVLHLLLPGPEKIHDTPL